MSTINQNDVPRFVIMTHSADGAPWAPDPSHFCIDPQTRHCINFVASHRRHSGPSPSVLSPWGTVDIVTGPNDSYRSRSSAYLAGSDVRDREFDEDSASSDGSWEFMDVESARPSQSTPPSSQRTSQSIQVPKRGEPLPETIKLEETIQPELLPDILLVNDPEGKTKFLKEFDTCQEAVRYKRVYPRLESHGSESSHIQSEGFLDFAGSVPLGNGSHSRVFRARLRLPFPLTSKLSSSGDVTVAAKTSLSDNESHRMLRREAKLYSNLIPAYFSEDWTGYHFISDATYDGDGIVPVVAVIPKSYGFYVPEQWSYRGLLSPIMLIEECGSPIDRETLTSKERALLYSFVARLHRAGVCQNSFKAVNVLKQAGPLNVAPTQRSLETPSFRLIDFGRGERRDEMAREEWKKLCQEEIGFVKEELYGRKKELRDPVSGKKYVTRRFLKGNDSLR